MKALKLIIAGLLLFFAVAAEAQISVQINVGTPPQWGSAGYSDVRYYYLPDVEAYYDISNSMFIYNNGITWVHHSYLPSRYRNYDLYNGYKVVMSDYRGNTPYANFKNHRTKYAKGYRGEHQKTYGQRPERKSSNERDYSKGHDNQKYKQGRGEEKQDHSNSKKSKRGRGNGKKR
ncbi:MAG: hypothetical protein WC384_22805 [Prolixibacteraceae bacterium]|jgi:hypothetical protein